MKRSLFFPMLFALLLAAPLMRATVVSYVSDDKAYFPNPERGYYEMAGKYLYGSGSSVVSDSYFTQGAAANRSLVMLHYYLSHYADGSAITDADLNIVSQDFAKFRAMGFKAIVRFSYGERYNSSSDYSHEASESAMYAHMEQLKPILAANADVIYVVQAGFIGVWGEWYYSYQFGTDCANDREARNRIGAKILEMTPADRAVQFRTPRYMVDVIAGGYNKGDFNTPLTESTAFTGSAASRVAHHNDAFCNGAQNLGTYSNVTTEKAWLSETGRFVPVGGETCLGTWDNNYAATYATYNCGSATEADMSSLHYDFLGASYSQYVTGNWKTEYKDGENYYDRFSRLLGYRYEMLSASLPDSAAPGAQVRVQLLIRNLGYSQLYNERHAYLVFRSGDASYKVMLASDPRQWQSNNAVTRIDETVTLPADMSAGTYTIRLALPDAYASIASNPAYAVRFANPGIWDAANGENYLNASVVIAAGLTPAADPTLPEPEDDPTPQATTSADMRIDLGTAVDPANQSQTSTWALSADSVLTIDYSTPSAWGYTGVAFPIDSLTNIISVTFDYKGSSAASQWTVLLPFLQDASERWYDGADYTIMSDDWQTVTMTPSKALWNDSPAHGYGAEPITSLGFFANPMAATTASFAIRNVTLQLRVPATAVETLPEQPSSVRKVFRDGHICILTPSGTFDLTGRKLD